MHKLILILSAVAAEAFTAYSSLPAAKEQLGPEAGIAATTLITIAIFYSWFGLFATKKKPAVKMALFALVAFLLIPVSALTVFNSSQLPERQVASVAKEASRSALLERQASADKIYAESMTAYNKNVAALNKGWADQESGRLSSLRQINAEIKATKKAKQPDIYAALIEQQMALSRATPKPTYPSKPQREIIKPTATHAQSEQQAGQVGLSIVQSVLFPLLTPIFLWIASCLPDNKFNRNLFGALFARLFALINKNERGPVDQPAQVSVASSVRNQCPLAARQVPADADGKVTVARIESALKISNRQARKLQKEAVKSGALIKKGNTYLYPTKPSSQVVVLRHAGQQ